MKKDPQIAVVMVSQSRVTEDFIREECAQVGLTEIDFCRKGFPPIETPLLILGDRPVTTLTGDARTDSKSHRGLWIKTVTGHMGYVMREIEELEIIEIEEQELREAWMAEWRGDLQRMAKRVLKQDAPREMEIQIFRNAKEAAPILRRLALYKGLWAFDIESFDAVEIPSRKDVSTDPCHEDFRVRGVALAWTPTKGAWVELQNDDPEEARGYLDPAFTSLAPKCAFNGPFDEEGLTYNGWVSEVRNRAVDGMLQMVALSDGRHASLRLERAVVDFLGFPQYWNGIDKGRIRELSIQDVGRSAVEDACATLALCQKLQGRLDRGEYFEWPTWVQKPFKV